MAVLDIARWMVGCYPLVDICDCLWSMVGKSNQILVVNVVDVILTVMLSVCVSARWSAMPV